MCLGRKSLATSSEDARGLWSETTLNLRDDADKPTLIDAAGITLRLSPGRIRMEAPDLLQQQGEAFVDRLLQRTLAMEAVDGVSIDRQRGMFTIEYEPRGRELAEMLTEIAAALRGEAPRMPDCEVTLDWSSIPGVVTRIDRVRKVSVDVGVRRSGPNASRWASWFRRSEGRDEQRAADEDEIVFEYREPLRPDEDDAPVSRDLSPDPPETCHEAEGSLVASGWKRALNFAAAGGCFALSIVGFIMPGIPTVPFVLGTSYFLVRSTPALNERLRRSRLFGQMVRDFEDEGGMRASTKARTLVLMFGMLGGSILLAGTSAPVLGMTAVVAGIDLAIVFCLPTIPSEPRRLEYEAPHRALLTA